MSERLSFTEYKNEFLLRLALLSRGDMALSIPVDDVAKEIDGTAPKSWSREAVKDLLRLGAVSGGKTLSDQHVEITGYGYEEADRYAGEIGMDLTEEISELERVGSEHSRGVTGPAFASSAFAGSAFAVDEKGNNLTDESGNRITWGATTTDWGVVQNRVKSQPKEIADMALALARTLEHEIERLQPAKPNDAVMLAVWQTNQDFLTVLRSRLLELNEALATLTETSEVDEEKVQNSVSILKRIGLAVGEWISDHSGELIDSSIRISVIGLHTGFLGMCGAPVAAAFGVSAALIGGPKAKDILVDVIKSAKG
jgi:hypothetical protein